MFLWGCYIGMYVCMYDTTYGSQPTLILTSENVGQSQ